MKERDHYGDLGVEENIILKLIMKKYNERVGTRFIWLRIRPSLWLL
jgi:hypothetical protein